MKQKLSKVCKYPNRLNCNYTEKQKRCEFMNYKIDGSGFSGLGGYWYCKYKEMLI